MLILVIRGRYQFTMVETKTEIIQFMEKEPYCPFMGHSLDLRYVFQYDG